MLDRRDSNGLGGYGEDSEDRKLLQGSRLTASSQRLPLNREHELRFGRKTLRVYGVAPELQVASLRPLRPNPRLVRPCRRKARQASLRTAILIQARDAGFAKCAGYQQTWAPEVQT